VRVRACVCFSDTPCTQNADDVHGYQIGRNINPVGLLFEPLEGQKIGTGDYTGALCGQLLE